MPEVQDSSQVASVDDTSTNTEAPPLASGPNTPPPQEDVALATPGESDDVRTEAAGYTTALLLRSGYPNHIILSADAAISGDVPPGDAVWELEDVMGSTHIVSGGTPEDIKSSISGGLLEKCGGVLTTRIINSDPTHMHFTLQCGAATPKLTQYLVLPRDAGGSYVFAFIGRDRRWDGRVDRRGGLQQGHRRLRAARRVRRNHPCRLLAPGRSRIAAKRNGRTAKKRESVGAGHAGRSPQGNQVAGISRRADARRGARIRCGRPPGDRRDAAPATGSTPTTTSTPRPARGSPRPPRRSLPRPR